MRVSELSLRERGVTISSPSCSNWPLHSPPHQSHLPPQSLHHHSHSRSRARLPSSSSSSSSTLPPPPSPPPCHCDGCRPTPVHSVAVIGAGPVGLAAIKSMKEVGIASVVCFEQESAIGGVWRYVSGSPGELKEKGVYGSAYEALDTNSSVHMTEYSDFPYLRSAGGAYSTHNEILQYFNDYAHHFDLFPHIRLKKKVVSMKRVGLNWELLILDEQKHYHKMFFDAVMVCSGQFSIPSYPDFPGQSSFLGESFHSHYYRSPNSCRGKNVVLVGVGNSALDIAAALAPIAASVTISSRSGALVVDSDDLGPPFDTEIFTRFKCEYARPKRNKMFFDRMMATTKEMQKRGLVKPPPNPIHAHTSILKRSKRFYSQVDSGKIRLTKNMKEIKQHSVVLESGEEVPCDVLIYCTGYKFRFPFIENSLLPGIEKGRLDFHRLLMHPEYRTLNVLGVIDSLGSMFAVGEMQSRYLAQLFAGNIPSPCVRERKANIGQYVKRVEKTKPLYQMFVDYFQYQELFAKDIGALYLPSYLTCPSLVFSPKPSFHSAFQLCPFRLSSPGCKPDLSSHPELFEKLMFGPLYTVQYRLNGPFAWDGAAPFIAKL
eukprot:TRINITY_DN711_c0_g2_i1.p1 TRINITY_DN711_c0_g2~~TRINITY_DN711_c0_g2_i1.p1  ORF type:complete len:600 (-),score=116.57 TRINITY_DN711_c0_g2_i1:65-1864(-)